MCTVISYSLTPCILDHHLTQLNGQILNYRLMQVVDGICNCSTYSHCLCSCSPWSFSPRRRGPCGRGRSPCSCNYRSCSCCDRGNGEHSSYVIEKWSMPLYSWASKIGINYASHPNSRFRLKHCVEDAYCMANFLCGTAMLIRRDDFSDDPFSQPRLCAL